MQVRGGHVLTFDDITQQLLDQRRAAWSDVARRIAHEIKNPLTPIQLAAERLQRRYGKEIQSDPATFERLTGTIVRQVGDLRRMVDEFSSFARMPKPRLRAEPLADIARQALFLHEVAHPEIGFSLDAPDPSPVLVCDRRQLGQALTNIVKNGVEAIERKSEVGEGDQGRRRIAMTIGEEGRGHHRGGRQRHRPARRARPADRTLYDDPRQGHRPRPRNRQEDRRGASRPIEFADAPAAARSSGWCSTRMRSRSSIVLLHPFPKKLTQRIEKIMALDILIVDDERDIRELVAGVLEDEGCCRTSPGRSPTTIPKCS